MILSSPHQNISLPSHSANCRGERTMKLMVAATEAEGRYRDGRVYPQWKPAGAATAGTFT